MASMASIRPSVGRILNSYRATTTQTLQITPLVAILSSGFLQQQQQQRQQQQQPQPQRCPFSTTPARNQRRPRRDNNRLRGLSSIYRSGPRYRMNVRREEVPDPAADYDLAAAVEVDPNHGLWQFFYAKDKLLLKPEEEAAHGRAWTVEELRGKSWEDLHRLWWVCAKEQNRIATHRREKQNMGLKNGVEETAQRLAVVRKTMKAIKHALTERFYLWEDARTLAASDPEIDLSGEVEAYRPHGYYEAEQAALETEEPAATEEEGQHQLQEGQALEPGVEPEKSGAEKIDPSTLSPKPAETQQETQQTTRP